MIDFLVNIVNPRNGETVIDPTVGIADFLSVSYVNSKSKLDDKNIFGMDIDDQMVMLATLNMLLNGDGNAKIISQTDGYGSLLTKFENTGETLQLIPEMNQNGDWDIRPDTKKLKKFDVVLTNPPFGEDRAFVPKDPKDLEVIKCYELWKLYGQKEDIDDEGKKKKNKPKEATKIDLGVIFLENAFRILKENGRMGIVLSNSIASIDAHRIARQWLLDNMRIVALFDMPANSFAETETINDYDRLSYFNGVTNIPALVSEPEIVTKKKIKSVLFDSGYYSKEDNAKLKKRIKESRK